MTALFALVALTATAAEPVTDTVQPPVAAVSSSSDFELVKAGGGKQKRPWLAAGLNWFIPGAGYMYNGKKPAYVTVPMMAGAAGLTYVENFHQFEGGTLREVDSTAFAVTFGSVLVLNTGLAIDAFREARSINIRGGARASLRPTVLATADGSQPGLQLDARF